MKVGLIDVDGHRFPNLALMRLSSYHKARGDTVDWWWTDFEHYDRVYMSKIFSDAYTKDKPEPMNADEVVKGGQGTALAWRTAERFLTRARTFYCRRKSRLAGRTTAYTLSMISQ